MDFFLEKSAIKMDDEDKEYGTRHGIFSGKSVIDDAKKKEDRWRQKINDKDK